MYIKDYFIKGWKVRINNSMPANYFNDRSKIKPFLLSLDIFNKPNTSITISKKIELKWVKDKTTTIWVPIRTFEDKELKSKLNFSLTFYFKCFIYDKVCDFVYSIFSCL